MYREFVCREAIPVTMVRDEGPDSIDVAAYRGRPVLARRRITREISEARIRRGWSQSHTAKLLGPGWSHRKYRNWEGGQFKLPDPGVVYQFAKVFGWDALKTIALRKLMLEIRNGTWWWDNWGDVLPKDVIALESDASQLRIYEPQNIPGLFQTPEYITATAAAFPAWFPACDEDRIARHIVAHGERQRLLVPRDRNPPAIHTIVEEAALTHRWGAGMARRRQLDELATWAARSNITVQVVPRDAALHAGTGQFAIMDFPQPEPPAVSQYGDAMLAARAQVIEDRQFIQYFLGVWDSVSAAALSPASSIGFLETLRDDADE